MKIFNSLIHMKMENLFPRMNTKVQVRYPDEVETGIDIVKEQMDCIQKLYNKTKHCS